MPLVRRPPGWRGPLLVLLVWLAACGGEQPAGPPPPSPAVALGALTAPASEPDASDLARYQPWASADEDQGRRLVEAFERALVSIRAAYLAESPTPLGAGVIGPSHAAEWAEVIATVRAGAFQQTFHWAYRVHPAVLRDPTQTPIAYRLVVATTDLSQRIERASGRVSEPPDGPERACRFVALHEEGGTLKVIAMRRVPPRFCPQGWPA